MIKKLLKRVASVGLSAVVMASLMVGCGSSSSTKTTDAVDPSKLEAVKLKMYLIGDKPKDFDVVYDKINEKMKQKINATLDVNFIPFADVNSKYQLLFQSGEDFDLVFTATGWAFYNQVATKNGFYELTDDMLKKYAPNIYADQPKVAWDQAKIKDKIYMIAADKKEFGTQVFGVRGDLMKKYGIDKIENYDQLKKYWEVASQDKNLKAVMAQGGQQFLQGFYLDSNEQAYIKGAAKPQIVYDLKDTSGKISYYLDTPQGLAYYKEMREFAQKGYWAADSISSKATRDADFAAGNTATMIWNLSSVAQKVKQMNTDHPEWDVQLVDVSKGIKKLITPYVNNGMAINAISKNPERALMALDLLRSDKELYDLTNFGIQGTHWEPVGDDKFKTLDATKNFPAQNVCPWGWTSSGLLRIDEKEAPIVKETKDTWESKDLVENPMASFVFDDSNVKNESAAVGNIITQYGLPLDLGMVEDVDAGVKQYKQKLIDAGIEKIYQECQKQVNEYLASYKKK